MTKIYPFTSSTPFEIHQNVYLIMKLVTISKHNHINNIQNMFDKFKKIFVYCISHLINMNSL